MKAIVFVLRGCSAAWLGAYGNEWIATPHLDRLAAEGIVFDRHISNCPTNAAACNTWLKDKSSLQDRAESRDLLASLKNKGIQTILVRANHPDTDSPAEFYAEWGELFDARPQEEGRFALDSLIRSFPALLERLAKMPDYLLWIDIDSLLPPWNIRQEVFEAYVEDIDEDNPYPEVAEEEDEESVDESEEEPMDVEDDDGDEPDEELDVAEEIDDTEDSEEEREPVTPWADPPTGLFDGKDSDAREWLHYSLAATVTGLDAELGVIFQQLRDHGLDRTATWLLTSDFGYPLGEHGQIGQHRPWLYEELVHLPLLLRLPDGKEACRRIGQLTQPEDIAPTILDLFGLNCGKDKSERASLLPLARGETTTSRAFAMTRLVLGSAEELAIRTEEWAFLFPVKVPEAETREPQLFGKPDDRWEVNDLRSKNIERCDEFEEMLKKVR
jgi:arylsulfatase A-like enzyme